MASLYLIRHAEPDITGLFLGQLDSRLSAAGLLHAQTAMPEIRVAAVYSSSLRRARETAAYINSPQVVIIEDLREIDFGLWTGKSWLEIEREWPELAQSKSADWLGVPAPGGETWAQLLHRVCRAFDQVKAGPQPAAIVAHQAVNAALASLATGCDPLAFQQSYGEVTRVHYD